jgi:UDP-N-acetylmuramate--alanine ligase
MIRIGIFFGGASREREVSFAGGRTVYDNLDKSLFEAVPIFIDAFGNFIELKWEYIYRGTIRDFFPPSSYLKDPDYQIYSESAGLPEHEYARMVAHVGVKISPSHLKEKIDFAFLALHGSKGEDGTIQGLLEWFDIPYSGSGMLPSTIGISKKAQKTLLKNSPFNGPKFITFTKQEWNNDNEGVLKNISDSVGFPLVVKSSNQGSSIGVKIIHENNFDILKSAVNHCFFTRTVHRDMWFGLEEKKDYIRDLADLRSGLGFPLMVNNTEVLHPAEFEGILDKEFMSADNVFLEAINGETELVVEQLIKGREFSCIVIRNEDGTTLALPPTEIVKKGELFDYRSKYLPGLSRKITPINIDDKHIQRIRTECSDLFQFLGFHVYARLDGFINSENEIFLNDPNTTSGMMPSSFFFHQAAEIGLNPSQFLTYIIRTSLIERIESLPSMYRSNSILNNLNDELAHQASQKGNKERIGIIMGGYSSERHISVESGRNIFEKLSSSTKYEPFPVFLTGNDDKQDMYLLPINMMLKDNADDIKLKIENYAASPTLEGIIDEAQDIRKVYCSSKPSFEPVKISFADLANECNEVFIALHGRPGEDGAIQQELDKFGLAYNGSGVASSQQTINKHITNKTLRDAGFLVADFEVVTDSDWSQNKERVLGKLERLGYPLIAKPIDEGCSSAVIKISQQAELEAYSRLTFRSSEQRDAQSEDMLGVDSKDEFPSKSRYLVESFTQGEGAKQFLEITGGMLTHLNEDGTIDYEVFEPSEALSEGSVLTLAEKFLAGEGQNITPARFAEDKETNQQISDEVKTVFKQVAKTMNVTGYCRIDAFVRILNDNSIEVIIIEINSLPGMTPATCIYHQAAINGYKPFDFIDKILTFGKKTLHAS